MNKKTSTGISIETTVSLFDMVNAFLISSLIVVGTIVGILFLIWLTMIMNGQPAFSEASYLPDPSFGNEKPEGFADDILEPGVEEFPEVDTPQLADALEALTEAVSSVQANLDARDGDALEMGKGGGFGARQGGPGQGGNGPIPEYQRWKIEYDTPNIQEYARQLTFFDIDIGLISNAKNDVIRIHHPGTSDQIINSKRDDENGNLYFIHEKSRLRRWDESLARKLNLELDGKFVVQFYSDKTRGILRQIEGQYISKQNRQLLDVRRTRFKVVPQGGDFAFVVSSVDYQ
ncbi:MAG: hypothetical protein AAGA30_09105 [Planctomycetota bacterium]